MTSRTAAVNVKLPTGTAGTRCSPPPHRSPRPLLSSWPATVADERPQGLRLSHRRHHHHHPHRPAAVVAEAAALHLRYVTPRSTSFRISDGTRRRLAERAEREGTSATQLLERLIFEGIDALDHPGIVHRGPLTARRAALAAGPDVWELIARLRELTGSEEERIAALADETDLHPREIRRAIDYAAEHRREIERLVERNEAAQERSRLAAEERQALFA